ncbi:amidohydrolase [Aspergillus sclerotialis]|uniref:Peptidase M20 domain-containing protein 2 n=1 Tax=Aspergillus sclerotialis TaxID=2070753 RepID=A0A3A2ZMW1_9EURO|nr:amidohydrolase [Aspergillus sclerotialis]
MDSLDTNAQLIFDSIDDSDKRLEELNSMIHGRPETCYEEFQAHDTIVAFLENNNIKVIPHVFGLQTAFQAESGEGGRVVTFCAEYDALPQIGHGCGHNLIAVSSIAAFLGTVAALKASNIPGRVRLLGCPAEEGGGGKIKLIEAGAFKDVDSSLMVHPTPPVHNHTADVAGISYGTCLAAYGLVAVFTGRPAHAAAMPWAGVNALDAATLSYTAIGLLRQHIKPSDRINVILPEGGTTHNVIPDQSRVRCSVRSETASGMESLRARVENCFRGAATATGCTVNFAKAMDPYADIRPNESLCLEFSRSMNSLGQNFICDLQSKVVSAFSTDMGKPYQPHCLILVASNTYQKSTGNVTYEVPGFHGNFAIPSAPGVALHTEGFRDMAKTPEAHKLAMGVGKGMAITAMKVLSDDAFAKQVKDDFEADKKLR